MYFLLHVKAIYSFIFVYSKYILFSLFLTVAGPTWAVGVVVRLCPWVVQVACTTTPSSTSCSTPWASIMSRPALTGITTSESCGRTLAVVSSHYLLNFYVNIMHQHAMVLINSFSFFLLRHEAQLQQNQHSESGNSLWLQLCYAISQVSTVWVIDVSLLQWWEVKFLQFVTSKYSSIPLIMHMQKLPRERQRTTYPLTHNVFDAQNNDN